MKELIYNVDSGEEKTIVQHIKQDCRIRLEVLGSGSTLRFVGLVYASGNQQFHVNTYQHHVSGGSTSSVLIKTVLTGHANFTYDGTIRVEKDAQKTDAYQRNDNLVLSDWARAVSSPVLEILANDLRCTHGATVGNISPEELWYLQSRGISVEAARSMIARGFLLDGLKDMPDSDIDVVRLQINKIFN